jgi:hypothetical protein
MKTIKFVALALMCLGCSVYAQKVPGTSAAGGVSTGFDPSVQFEERQSIGGTVTGGIDAKSYMKVGPLPGSAELPAFLSASVAEIETHKRLTGSSSAVQAESFVGQVPWIFYDVTVGTNDTVSLSDMTVVLSTNDGTNNILGVTLSFGAGTTYTVYAFIIDHDGTKTTSGPASKRGKRVIFAVSPKYFTATLQEVKDYLSFFLDFALTSKLYVNGAANGQPVNTFVAGMPEPVKPELSVRRSGLQVIVTAESNGDPATYNLQKSTTVNGGWTSAGTIKAGGSVTNVITAEPRLFIRYAP